MSLIYQCYMKNKEKQSEQSVTKEESLVLLALTWNFKQYHHLEINRFEF